MPLTSDLKIDASKFREEKISEQTRQFNDKLIKIMQGGPKWYEVGAKEYRKMRWNGETPLPKPVVLESGKNIKLPSRDAGREIPCRVFQPESGKPKAVFYHIHGGGWVLQSEEYQDTYLKYLADHVNVTVVSVGYRLAPEDPYPAGNEDCFDIGEYLVDNSVRDYGVPMAFVGGDSAGGHLSVLTTFHLLETRLDFAFKGLILNFGAYDIAGYLPQMHHFDIPLVLDVDIMRKYIDAYVPGRTEEEKRDMWISPLYADLTKMKLPSALFTCGTLDCLLDDSILMSSKWAMAGAESILKVYPGACHGFVFYPIGGTETTQAGLDDIVTYMTEKL